jgi:molybdopterin/thiamine biosynthesis adenylyltransferase
LDTPFNYFEAFSRNIGWVTREEQAFLRTKRIAIAGLGGVGGIHLLTLARLGIGAFTIADFDQFEQANFNRQAGAMVSTLGQPKVQALARMAFDINPELNIRIYPEGITHDNVREFLKGADLFVDGMDLFSFDARQSLYAACSDLGIPATNAGPLGMSAALMNFLPGGMTFDEYYGWENKSDDEKALRLLIGHAPARLHFRYLVDPTAVNLSKRRGPSTVMACQLCAGMVATEVLKILLNRGKVLSAPWGIQFDAYRNKFVRTWRPGGNRNPIQRFILMVARRKLAKIMKNTSP